MLTINVCGKIDSSLVNGEGFRTVIFLAGCSHGCNGCHNKEYSKVNCGVDFTIDELMNIIYKNSKGNKKRITLSGGDPFFQAEQTALLTKRLKEEGFNIWCYTGYTIEQLLESNNHFYINILKNIDILVDGRFEYTLTEGALKYTGSSNQRIIDVKEYLAKYSKTF